MVTALAVGRTVAGAVAVAVPAWPATILLGREAASPRPRLLTRLVGARDIALGVAALAAARDGGRRARQLTLLGALCDTADASFTLLEPDLGGRARRAAVPVAGVSAAAGAWALRRLGGHEDPDSRGTSRGVMRRRGPWRLVGGGGSWWTR